MTSVFLLITYFLTDKKERVINKRSNLRLHNAFEFASSLGREANYLISIRNLIQSVFIVITYARLRCCSWLRHCATNPKVAVSIPNCVIGVFHSRSPSDRIMSLESTHTPIEKLYQVYFLRGKVFHGIGLTKLPS